MRAMVTIYEEKYPSHRSPVSRCILLMCLLTVLCGETESNCYLHTNSVIEPPPGRPSGAAACIAHGGVGADSPHKMYPVHKSCPSQVEKSLFFKIGIGGVFHPLPTLFLWAGLIWIG